MRRDTGPERRPFLRAVTSEEGHRVTTLELFFDLAFVFAFTQLSRLMAQQHDAVGIVQALIILALLWWSWTAYSWLANLAHADEGIVRVAMIIAMTAMFVVALVALEAYDDLPGGLFAPLVFVSAYLIARITHAVVFTAVTWKASPTLRRRTLLTSVLSVVPSGTLLTVGALLGGSWQVWLGLAAVALEPIIAYRTSVGVEWPVRSIAHFTERHGLVIILALGESIIGVGVGVATEPVSVPILGGVVLAMSITVGMWWAYFSDLAGSAEHALVHRRGINRARVVSDGYTYLHLVLVAGIVSAAVGIEEAMAHVADVEPFGPFGAAALAGGVALYLAGTGFFARRVIGDWRVLRFAGAALLLAATGLLAAAPPIASVSGVAAILVIVLLAEHLTRSRRGSGSGGRLSSSAVRGR